MKVNPISISKLCTKTILDQMNKSLYKIEYEKRKFITGFFCHIKYENKNIPVLITNYQALYIEKNKDIHVTSNNETISIELGDIKYFNKNYDLSILQIKENKNINKIYFLELDENVYKNNYETYYKNKSIYTIHYNKDKNIYATFGIIKDIINSKMIYSSNINLNFKDFPIFDLSNNKLIGISKENSKLFNNGLFFNINEFINEFRNTKNEIDIFINIEDKDINKEIYFLDNNDNIHNNLKELNELNTELYINDIKQQYKKYFIPDKVDIYRIKIIFHSDLTDSSFMFAGCKNIINIYFIHFNTKYITNMKGMFLNCINLKNINLLSFDTKNVVDMSYMFKYCESLQNNLDLSSFDYNSVINKNNMLSGFNNLIKYKYEILSSDYTNYDLSFKMLFIEYSDSGKSSLIDIIFKDTYSPRVGFGFQTFNIRIKDKIIKLQTYNTRGKEMYRSLVTNFYRSASLTIIVYAINKSNNFNNIDLWIKDCKTNSSHNAKLFLIGNKIDIDEKE